MCAALLPRNFAVRNRDNNKYLRYVHEVGQLHGFLHFSGEEVTSPYCRFESELSPTLPHIFVHIRSAYNNRYWVNDDPPAIFWRSVVARADKINEDRLDVRCTAIQPLRSPSSDSPNDFAFVQYIGAGWNLWPRNEPANFRHETLHPSGSGHRYFMEVIDLDTLVTFPTHLAFRGDNNLHLATGTIGTHRYLQFNASDSAAAGAAHEVFPTRHGHIRLRNNQWGRFLRRAQNNYIWGDSTDDTDNNPDTVFSAIQIGPSVVALRNTGNNNFCRRFTDHGREHCFNAADGPVMIETRLTVSENVLSRRVFNVIYHLSNSRIHGHQPLMLATQTASNPHDLDISLELSFTHTKSTSNTWSTGISITTGVSAEFTAGVPFIAQSTVTVSMETTMSVEWSRTTTEENSVQSTFTLNSVPPKTRAVVRLMATRATCDVPFSYTQTDILTNGQPVTKTLHDGVFTGVNQIDSYYETDLFPL